MYIQVMKLKKKNKKKNKQPNTMQSTLNILNTENLSLSDIYYVGKQLRID